MDKKTYQKKRLKILEWKKLPLLMERHDKNGQQIPFYVKAACMNGDIIEGDNWVTTRVDTRKHRRTIMNIDSREVRQICDVLVLQVNDTLIVVS